ncbi:MAG: transposase [Legionellaceae bacterium]|nr:transposase [Legionellaceae bacterium]
MARPQRIEYENAYYHVMNRGAGRENIFHDDIDRKAFLNVIDEAYIQFGLEVHAYCLMDNHYHLLIKTPRANLSRIMRHINGVYTQRYNRRQKTDGALFRGRYKAILVDSDAYLLHLSKYIHLNPMSAKLVETLEDYAWSSYRAYIEKACRPNWLHLSEVYGQVGNVSSQAEAYRLFMNNQEISEDVLGFYRQQRLLPVLGDEVFISKLELTQASEETSRQERIIQRPTLSKIIAEVADFFDVQVSALLALKKGRGRQNTPRHVAMYLAQKHGDYRLKDIAKAFGLAHYGGVSSALHRLSEALKTDVMLSEKVNCIINRLDP